MGLAHVMCMSGAVVQAVAGAGRYKSEVHSWTPATHYLLPATTTHSYSPTTYPSPHTHIHHNGLPPLYVCSPATHSLCSAAIADGPRSHDAIAAAVLCSSITSTMTPQSNTSTDLPPVKPSAIALGTAFNHAISLAVLGPVFGDAYRRAQQANSKEEYFNTKEAATAAASWGSSIVGSAVQAYGVGALINATGTLTYKGAAYLGSLIFFASAAPSVCHMHCS